MQEIFKGFLMLRLLAFVPLLIIVLVLVGVSALKRGESVLGIAVLAGVPLVAAVALGSVRARRTGERSGAGQY